MSTLNRLLAQIVSTLDSTRICKKTQILETARFSHEQFTVKIRATLIGSLTLQIRLYYNKGHYDYSYQLFSHEPLCRWDNAEHFPHLRSFPHHYHTIEGDVIESPLIGRPVEDLPVVLNELATLLAEKKINR